MLEEAVVLAQEILLAKVLEDQVEEAILQVRPLELLEVQTLAVEVVVHLMVVLVL
jgi:hypothetical protein